MFEWDVGDRHFVIREAQSEADYHAVEDVQRIVWSFSELDIVPAAILIATQHAGGMVLGAFEGDKMIGFAYGFPAFEHGRASIHSHMLAVLPQYRNVELGFNLKLAQRDLALANGLDEMTWTYDPLLSLNAHLNFEKLGVISSRYIVNFYGGEASNPLNQGFGTDRLWVRWSLTSDRVKGRIASHKQSPRTAAPSPDSNILSTAYQFALVRREDDQPRLADFGNLLSGSRCFIEIPHDIPALKQRDAEAARAWREATRAAFLAAIEAGFTVQDFMRTGEQQSPRWFYLLSR